MKFKSALPSAITCLNLLCGFLVLVSEPKHAVILILLGGFFDLWDGLVARILQAQSEFGAQLDSLADMVTFCVAPAFLLFNYIDHPLSYICLLIPVTGALRLAKFNISTDQSYYFKGLATPSSAMMFCGIYLARESLNDLNLLVLVLIIVTCVLNVTNLKMFSLKGLKKDPFTKFYLVALLIITAISTVIDWRISLLVTVTFYLLLSIGYHYQITNRENINTATS